MEALIQAAGQGARLGLGAKAFVMLGGATLLERAVETCLAVADRVIVAVAEQDLGRAAALLPRERVDLIAGGTSRSDTTRRLVSSTRADLLLLHDVVHPLAGRALIERVCEAARIHGAAAPALPNADFIYSPEGEVLHAPGDVFVGQKPVAFSRAAAGEGYSRSSAIGSTDPSFLDVLKLGGARTVFVAGEATNIKITYPYDLQLAAALLRQGAAQA